MRFMLTILVCLASTPTLAIDINGQTEFAQRLSVNSSISARIRSIEVAVGEQVTAGEVFLTLVATGLQANVDIARARVNALAPGVDKMLTELEKAQELYDRDSLAQVDLQNAEHNHVIAQSHLAAADAELVRAQFLRSQAELHSPIDGVVLSITGFAGQYINTRTTDQTLLTIVDNSSMIVKALLPLELWDNSLLDRPARVSFQKQVFDGRVIEIGNQVSAGDNSHPAVTVLVKLKTDGKLPAGLPVIINIRDN